MADDQAAIVRQVTRDSRSLSPSERARPWLLGLLAAAVLVGLALWVNRVVERSLATQLVGTLTAVRDSQAEALRAFAASQKRTAEAVAEDDDVRGALTALRDERRRVTPGSNLHDVLRAAPQQARLRDRLGTLATGAGYLGYGVVDVDGTVLSSRDESFLGTTLPIAALVQGKTSVVLPPAPIKLPSGAEQVMMFAVAPIRDGGNVLGGAYLRIDPAAEFSAIAQRGRMGESGETYAFDAAGHLLSDSRFLPQLRQAGLVGPDATQAIWNVQARDPGGNLLKGYRASIARSQLPLTKAVSEAVQRRASSDVKGYADYRGVPVVGAWAWLEDLGLGIVTEQDVAEAFALRDGLQLAFVVLLATLTLTLGGIVIGAHWLETARRRTASAERRALRLGQYTLDRKLGEGGMGAVYEGHHEMLRRPTAIKLLKASAGTSDPAQDERNLARFKREVEATALLTHPNTIAVYDFGRTPDGVFYYAMEYLKGVNLDDLVLRTGPLPEARVIHLMLQACGSLAEAHAAGMVHRDIKPANMMTCERGGVWDTLKVLDFGLVSVGTQTADSKLTAAGIIMGTPQYMAPEVIKDPDAAGPASDIYALGATMYYLLTGHDVFEKTTVTAICMAHLVEEPVPPSQIHRPELSADLERVVLACLSKNPGARPPSIRELARLLATCANARAWDSDKAAAWWATRGPVATSASSTPEHPVSGSAETMLHETPPLVRDTTPRRAG